MEVGEAGEIFFNDSMYMYVFVVPMKFCDVCVALGIKVKSRCSALMAKELRCILSKILGGLNNLRSSVYSQYYYYIGQ